MKLPPLRPPELRPPLGRRWYDETSECEALKAKYPSLVAYMKACRDHAQYLRPDMEPRRREACKSSAVLAPALISERQADPTLAQIRRSLLLDRWFSTAYGLKSQFGDDADAELSTLCGYNPAAFDNAWAEGAQMIEELDTDDVKASPWSIYYRAWKKRWNLRNHADRLRALYNNDKDKYMRAFWRDDRIVVAVQEDAMSAFAKMTTKLEKRARFLPYEQRGRQALDTFCIALESRESTAQSGADLIFVSLDFEGSHLRKNGLAGFGVAQCDTRHLFRQDLGNRSRNGPISCTQFKLKALANNKCLFGPTIRVDPDNIGKAVSEALSASYEDGVNHQIVLISHGIGSAELPIMDHLGIPIEDLPIAGIIDTNKLDRDTLSHKGTLGSLLARLGIPVPAQALHIAGNDAYYTMLALLGMAKHKVARRLSGEAPEVFGLLDEILLAQIPEKSWIARECDDESDAYDLGDTFM